ncbi:MAG: TFIIB-type zinc ribbon-containing protein, partial [Chloroflexi bacterium]|nr:TFIIB-type zinc ribbon-containing protein [Chloroflexota bacterium]
MSDLSTPTQSHESFECANCGAPRMEFDPASGMLKCPQCGTTREIQASAEQVKERDLIAALSDAGKARGMGREMKAVQCQTCGAVTQYEPNVTSVTCPFCGSSQVLEQQPDPNLIRPESLAPFAVDREAARGLYRKWLGRGFFRPKDLSRRAGAEQMTGVYLPFWTFDAHAESNWRAESGDYYYVTEHYTEMVDGKPVQKTRQGQRVRWDASSGRHRGDYDDILIKASETLDS